MDMRYFLKTGLTSMMVFVLVLLMAGLCFAFGGKVTYPDGSPAVGAKVSLVDKDGGKKTVICDAQGQFQFAQLPSDDAEIQIKASNGKDYAKVKLPVSLFSSGNVAIVLQPK
jgi:hypothetical protein